MEKLGTRHYGAKRGRGETVRRRLEFNRQRDNAHCAFINYHLALYLNVSIAVICEFSMTNVHCEMRNAK
jgi:hypothetical protein